MQAQAETEQARATQQVKTGLAQFEDLVEPHFQLSCGDLAADMNNSKLKTLFT